MQGPLFFTKGTLFMDLLQQAAKAWKEITEYRYLFTYGYKKQLYPINLAFSLEDFSHLAGFQYIYILLDRLSPQAKTSPA